MLDTKSEQKWPLIGEKELRSRVISVLNAFTRVSDIFDIPVSVFFNFIIVLKMFLWYNEMDVKTSLTDR